MLAHGGSVDHARLEEMRCSTQRRSRDQNIAGFKNDWLGGRDSNPDRQIQNLQSYRWTTSQQ
jgi:hypothetical protein